MLQCTKQESTSKKEGEHGRFAIRKGVSIRKLRVKVEVKVKIKIKMFGA